MYMYNVSYVCNMYMYDTQGLKTLIKKAPQHTTNPKAASSKLHWDSNPQHHAY